MLACARHKVERADIEDGGGGLAVKAVGAWWELHNGSDVSQS